MLVLVAIGAILATVGWFWVLILAFRESVIWGIFAFLFGPIWLIFGVMHLDQTKRPMLLAIGGAVLVIFGSVADARREERRQKLQQQMEQQYGPSSP